MIRTNKHRSGMTRTLLLFGLLEAGLAASTPALIAANWSETGSMNVARINRTSTLLSNG